MLAFSASCALGCLVRYGAEWSMSRFVGVGRLWGTLLVNVLGCFSVGLLLHQTGHSPTWILPFCGGLTSYSAAFAGPVQVWCDTSRREGVTVLCATPVLCVVACAIGASL